MSTNQQILRQIKLFQAQQPTETSLIERNREHIKHLTAVLKGRQDINMELGYH